MATLANLQKKVENTLSSRKQVLEARRAALEAKQLVGYQGGEKIGKHKVLSSNVDVQLGEDLSENMREVKVSMRCHAFRDHQNKRKIAEAQGVVAAGGQPLPGPIPSVAEPNTLGTASQTTVSAARNDRVATRSETDANLVHPCRPKRHIGRTKEYEKHAWKRFE